MDPSDQAADVAAPAVALAGRREWIGLAVLALACLLSAMDLTVLHLAVPSLSADLQPSSAQLLWITDIYGFMVAGFWSPWGPSATASAAAGCCCWAPPPSAWSRCSPPCRPPPEMLIASRALLGIAGATLAPSTLSLTFAMFADPRQRTTAIGIWITSFSAGGAVGPMVGGLLLERYWWGSVFLLALPVMALLLLGPILLPEYRAPDAGRLDLVSAAMSLVAVLAAVLGLKQTAQDGVGWLPVAAVQVGLVVGCCSCAASTPSLTHDRPAAVPHPGVQRVVGDQPARHLRRGRLLPVRRPVPAAGAGAVAAAGGPVVAAVGVGVHRRVQPGAADPAPGAPGAGDRRRSGLGRDRAGVLTQVGGSPSAAPALRRRLAGGLAGPGAGVHRHHRPGGRLGPAGAGGGGVGDL